MDSKLIVAEGFLESKDFEKAMNTYKDITENYSEDYRGWWGLVVASTENFTKYNLSKDALTEIKENAKLALALASDDEKAMINASWNEYKNGFKTNKSKNTPNRKTLESRSTGISKQLDELTASYETLSKSLASAERFTKFADPKNCTPLYVLMGIGALPIIIDLFANICPGWGKAIYIVLLALIIAPAIVMVTAKINAKKNNETIEDLRLVVADLEKEIKIKSSQLENVNEHLETVAPAKKAEQPRSKQTEYQLKVLQQLYNNKKITYAEYKRKKKELLKK